jgi:hypothetical protein
VGREPVRGWRRDHALYAVLLWRVLRLAYPPIGSPLSVRAWCWFAFQAFRTSA